MLVTAVTHAFADTEDAVVHTGTAEGTEHLFRLINGAQSVSGAVIEEERGIVLVHPEDGAAVSAHEASILHQI